MSASSPPDHHMKPSEPWHCEVVDAATFWREALQGGASVILGLPGGPLWIPGDGQRGDRETAAGNSPFLDRRQVAKMLGCHPDTLTRKRADLERQGLRARRGPGRKRMYRREDVVACMERQGLTGKRGRGRPRKIV